MIQYKLQRNNYTNEIDSATVIGVVTSIPFNPENTDYQAYLKWLEEGNTPLPADEQGAA